MASYNKKCPTCSKHFEAKRKDKNKYEPKLEFREGR